ncbi:hypothetical protein RvY_18577 [Ramazzottius varieornatus]|uniref:STAS domain-containing protein n=1 Tax=Ramazzottius varieornatus TaxID=947166 RepID=A0A1D1W698_RAMVA|nr:hypothetical protein RvY_18577 [Ramazzottius varieornatus]
MTYDNHSEEVILTEPNTSSAKSPGIAEKLRQSCSTSRFSIHRPIFSQAKFDDNNESLEHNVPATPWVKLKREVGRKLHSTFHSRTDCRRIIKKKVFRAFPLLTWLPRYDIRQNLLKDLIAGITVGIMNIPQGMAYGKLAGVPHVYGLYTSFFPLLMYTLMGTSRHVSVGTFAVVSLMTSKIVRDYEHREAKVLTDAGLASNWTQDNEGHEENVAARVYALITVAFCVGIWQMGLGLFGLGSLTVYLSDQLIKGFTCGASFHVFTSQLKPVFGLRNMTSHSGAFKLIKSYGNFFSRIKDTHPPTLAISLTCIGVLLFFKYFVNENRRVMAWIKFPLPSELLVIVFGAVASYTMKLREKYNVTTVHKVPVGFPQPQIPDMTLVPEILMDTFAIAVVGFTITVSLGKLFAQRFQYEIDPKQELKALGTMNIFGSFFQCIPATGSLARSAVQVAVGGMTQIVSVVAACFVLVVLLALGHLLEPLPEACLGAIIMVALINMLKQVTEIGRLWKVSLIDTSVFVVALLAVLLLDVDSGLLVGLSYSLLTVILRTQRPEVGLLGRVPQTDIYKRLDSYKSAMEVPGIKIIRLDAPLYFANAEYFRRVTFELCELDTVIEPAQSRPTSPERRRHRRGSKYQSFAPTTWHDEEVDPNVGQLRLGQLAEVSVDSGTLVLTPPRDRSESLRSRKLSGSLPHHVIFDCSSVCYMDVTGVEMVEKMALECRKAGIEFLMASCKANLRETLFLSGFTKRVGPDQLYLTVHDAVLFAVKHDGPRKPSLTVSGGVASVDV